MTRLFILLSFICFSAQAQKTFTWGIKSPYPKATWGMVSCGHNGKLYSIGKCGGTDNTLYSYTPAADKWDTLAAYTGTSFCNTGMAGVGDKLYLLTNDNKIVIYDIPTNVWDNTGIAFPPAFKKDGVSMIPVGTDIYCVAAGGYASCFKINTVTNIASSIATMTQPRLNAQSVLLNNKIYVFNGRQAGSALTNKAEVYDIAADTWTDITTTTLVNRYFGYAFTDGTYIYFIGGETGTVSTKYKAIEMYDLATNTATVMAASNNMNYEHTAHAAGMAGSTLVVAGGFTNTPTLDGITNVTETQDFSTTSIAMQQAANEIAFRMYPNPAKGTVNVHCKAKAEYVQVYDVSGRLVINQAVNAQHKMSIDISTLQKGNYILTVKAGNLQQSQLLQVTE